MKKFIISIDAGTTSNRSILFDLKGRPIFSSQKEFTQYFPNSGWVEHNPEEIWKTTLKTLKDVIQKAKKFQPKKISNSIAASDAFFPFSDGLELLIKAGVKIVIQPGGSIRDKEIVNYANKAKIKMLFTGIRHFYH